MRKNIVAGNWKMNMNLQEGIALAKELNEALAADKPNCDVVICTPFIHLASVTPIVDEAVIGVGAENCADKVSATRLLNFQFSIFNFQLSILKVSPGFGITISLNPAFSKTLLYGTCAS